MQSRSLTRLFLYVAIGILVGVRPLYGEILNYRLSGVVIGVDRDTPRSLTGAPAVMSLIYDTDSFALREPFGDTFNMSMLASGTVDVDGVTLKTFAGVLLYEHPHDLGPFVDLDSSAGYGGLADGRLTFNLTRFSQFEADGSLFTGTQLTGDIASGSVLFSSPGLPDNTNNELIAIGWNSIALVPEPSATALLAAVAPLLLKRRRRFSDCR